MKVKILHKIWNLFFVDEITQQINRNENGYCESPDTPNKGIYIRKTLVGEKKLEVIIHEFLHAADWYKDEEWVECAGRDLAKLLIKLGYKDS